jgi:fibronectin type 3 domain-containing protein
MKLQSLLVTIITCLALSCLANAAVIWETGFESPTYNIGTLVPQDSWEYHSSFDSGNDVTNDNVYAGSQAVRLFNNGAGHADYSMVRRLVDMSGVNITDSVIRFSCHVWPNTKYDGFRIYDSGWGSQVLLAIRDTGVGLGGKSFQAHYTNWNAVSLVFDVLNQEVIQFTVNSETASISTAATFMPAGIRLSAQHSQPWPLGSVPNTYFDNVRVETEAPFRVGGTPSSIEFPPGETVGVFDVSSLSSGETYTVQATGMDPWISSVEPSSFTADAVTPVSVTVTINRASITAPVLGAVRFSSDISKIFRDVTLSVQMQGVYTNACKYSFPASYDGTGTTVTDIGGLGNDATLLSNANAYVAGEYPSGGSGGSFNAGLPNDFYTDAPIILNNNMIALYGGFSYDVWIKWNGEACPNGKIIDYAGTDFISLNDGELKFGMVNNPGYTGTEISTNGLVQDVWYHVVAIFNTQGNSIDSEGGIAGLMQLFVDDELVARKNWGKGTFGDDLNRSIGFGNHPNHYANNDFKGMIYNPCVSYGVIPMPVPPNPPLGVSATDDLSDKIQVSWHVVSYATKYTVYRSKQDDSATATDISGEITGLSYDDTSAQITNTYYYWVKAGNDYGFSDFSASDAGFRKLPGFPDAPQNVQATDGTYKDKVDITWSAVSNTDAYIVFRNTEDNSAGAADISGEITETTYSDTDAEPGIIYYYWVRAKNSGGLGPFSAGDQGYLELPGIVYDGFDYTAGEVLDGKDGGYGWPGTWLGIADGTVTIQSPGLEYDILKTAGNCVRFSPTNAHTSGQTRSLSATYGNQVTTLWASSIMQVVNEETASGFGVQYAQGLSAGKGWGLTFWGLGNAWGQNQVSTVSITNQAFMLVRMDLTTNTSDTAYLWVNPPLDSEPDVLNADVIKVTDPDKRINFNAISFNGYQNIDVVLDEIRLGRTFREVAPTDAATSVDASDGQFDDRIDITWLVNGAKTKFIVLRNTTDDSSGASDVSGDITTNFFSDTTAVAGQTYYYWVQAYKDATPAPLSYSDIGFRAVSGAPDPPTNVQASDGTVETHVQITWTASSGATKYEVFRNTVDNWETAVSVSGEITPTEYSDSDVVPGRTYYYWVKAGNASGWSFFSDSDSGFKPAELVAYYRLNELEGTNALDSSANQFDGVYRDTPILGMQSVNPDLYNTAVGFNPDGGFGSMAMASNTPIRQLTNNFSVALWVKPEESELPGDQVFIGNPQVGIGWIVASVEGRIKFTTWAVQDYISSGTAVSNGAWTHIAVTMNENNNVQFYVDGEPFESLKIGPAPANYGLIETYLATDGNDSYPYFGVLDEVRVYQGLLSPDEIRDLAYIPEPGILGMVILAALGAFVVRRK